MPEKGGKAIGGNGLIGKATEAVGKGAGMLGKGLDKAGKAVQEFPPKPRATIGPPAAPSRQTAPSPNVRDHRTVPAQRLLTPVPSPRRVTVRTHYWISEPEHFVRDRKISAQGWKNHINSTVRCAPR